LNIIKKNFLIKISYLTYVILHNHDPGKRAFFAES
jgi:hypothetical protein